MLTLNKKLLASAMLILGLVISAAQAQARDEFETVTLTTSSFNLSDGETKSVYLDARRQIKKLIIQAEGVRNDGTFEVLVNGDVKGTVYVPGRDPSYIVTVAETASSVQFRHRSGATVLIREVKAVQSNRIVNDPCRRDTCWDDDSDLSWEARNQAAKIAARAIELVDALDSYTNYKDYGDYLLPIKKSAGVAYAKANARGSMSSKTRTALRNLQYQIEYAAEYIDDTFERSKAFDLAVELLNLKEQIDRALD